MLFTETKPRRPCKECPYMKRSMPGYFGGQDPLIYAEAMHQDTIIPCHMRSEYHDGGDVQVVTPCTGHLMSQKKVCKGSLHEVALEYLRDPRFYELYNELYDEVLGFRFYDHHGLDKPWEKE